MAQPYAPSNEHLSATKIAISRNGYQQVNKGKAPLPRAQPIKKTATKEVGGGSPF